MSTRNRTPPLLEPHLRLPPRNSQLLLTGVLDASPTWLVTRLLRSVLTTSVPSAAASSSSSTNDPTAAARDGGRNVSVVLVSWLRDLEFWKGEARRGAGLDLARLAAQNRFAFVDGLTGLSPDGGAKHAATAAPAPRAPPRQGTQPTRSPLPVPARGPPPSARSEVQTPPPAAAPGPPRQGSVARLGDPTLQATSAAILGSVSRLVEANPGSDVLLVLDGPTALLATAAEPLASPLSSLLLRLRAEVHSCALVVEADAPFLDAAAAAAAAAEQHHVGVATPLEAAHAAFVVAQAHVSDWVLGLRPLDTGKARDVSGVVRACRGGAWEVEGGGDGDASELEALYFVQADGGVKVFERGEASVG